MTGDPEITAEAIRQRIAEAERRNSPKVAGACSVCDTMVREVKRVDPDGRVTQFGRRLPNTRLVHLLHLDGSHSDHSLCATCDVGDLPTLWARQVMLYTPQADPPEADRFARNLPIGVLGYTTPSCGVEGAATL